MQIQPREDQARRNIGKSGLQLLRQAGHDIASVYEQGLSGATDDHLFRICSEEGRVLVTLDRDFGEILRFPPAQSAGIVILDLNGPATARRILSRLQDFLQVAHTHDVTGKLWIIEPGRVRIHLERE
ncbi:MAG: DUF5615 family PIN-like protein [Rhodomicrobium sp.]|nr:DUF5615 family PIN-like protein [Rhodomicrobium sp.]